MTTKKRITLRQFVKSYYDKEQPRRMLYGRGDHTEKSAKILKKKLGGDWKVAPSPYTKGRYIVFEMQKKEPFVEYYKKYKDELNIIFKQKY